MSPTIEFLAAHCTKVWVGDVAVLFSYTTPVACWIVADGEIRRYAVRERYSNTTSRHLKQFGPEAPELVTAAELARLLAEA